jgi:hypothetical protein
MTRWSQACTTQFAAMAVAVAVATHQRQQQWAWWMKFAARVRGSGCTNSSKNDPHLVCRRAHMLSGHQGAQKAQRRHQHGQQGAPDAAGDAEKACCAVPLRH